MISFEELKKYYQTSAPQLFGMHTQPLRHNEFKHALDRDAARSRVMQPSQWHDNVLKLVASYVAKGNTDKEIHLLTRDFTCDGYSYQQTQTEVQKMIDGARNKRFDKKVGTNKKNEQVTTESDPLPLIREFPPSAPYPIERLGPLQSIVQAVQKKTQAPVEIAAASALSTASLILQGYANVETLAGERPVSLYMLTVARSGERKSSCDGEFIFGIKQFEKELSKCHEANFLKFKNRSDIYNAERNSLLAQLRSRRGKITREDAEKKLDLLGPEPTAPPSTDIIVSEPTFEGLTQMYKNGQPALGLFSDEGGQFLGGHAMNADNRQKTLAAFNDLWSGNSIRRTRQGDGAYQLHDRRLAIHLMVQPTSLMSCFLIH